MYDTYDRWKLGLDRPAGKLELRIETDIDWQSVEIDGIWTDDYPDFSDAYLSYAEFYEGTVLTDAELEKASDYHADHINKLIHQLRLYKGI